MDTVRDLLSSKGSDVWTIQYLLVLDHGELVRIVSIRDLVKSRIADQEFLIEQFMDYIHGPVR